MTKAEAQDLIKLFLAQTKGMDVMEIKGKIIDTDTIAHKAFVNEGDIRSGCSIYYVDMQNVGDIAAVEIWLDNGHYYCDRFDIARMIIDHIKI